MNWNDQTNRATGIKKIYALAAKFFDEEIETEDYRKQLIEIISSMDEAQLDEMNSDFISGAAN